MEAWLSTTSLATNQVIAAWGSLVTNDAFIVSVSWQSINIDAGYDYLSFPTPGRIADGAWHFLAVSYDGKVVLAYLDGQQVGSARFSGKLDTSDPSGLSLGFIDYPSYSGLNGDLADVAVYPSAVGAAELAQQFEASGYSRPSKPIGDVHASFAGENAAEVTWAYPLDYPVPTSACLITAMGAPAGAPSVAAPCDATAVELAGLAAHSYSFEVQPFNQFGFGPASVSNRSLPSRRSCTSRAAPQCRTSGGRRSPHSHTARSTPGSGVP